jgi:hypothetical protein
LAEVRPLASEAVSNVKYKIFTINRVSLPQRVLDPALMVSERGAIRWERRSKPDRLVALARLYQARQHGSSAGQGLGVFADGHLAISIRATVGRVSLWARGVLKISVLGGPFPFYSLDDYAIALHNSGRCKQASKQASLYL